MYVSIGKKHSIYGLQSYPWFQASTVGLGTYALWITGDYYTQTISLYPRVINFHLDVPQPLKIWQSKWTRDSTASSNVICQYSLTQQAELPKFSPPCLPEPSKTFSTAASPSNPWSVKSQVVLLHLVNRSWIHPLPLSPSPWSKARSSPWWKEQYPCSFPDLFLSPFHPLFILQPLWSLGMKIWSLHFSDYIPPMASHCS